MRYLEGGRVMATRSSLWSPRWFGPVVLILAIVGAQSAAASGPPESSSGTFGPTGAPAAVSVRTADGNTFRTVTARPGRFTGTFTGAYSEDLRLVFHADGSFNFAAELTCQCTVDGKTGTMTIRLDGTGSPAAFDAHYRIIAATGGLEGLQGQGTLSGPVPSTYSGEHHFA